MLFMFGSYKILMAEVTLHNDGEKIKQQVLKHAWYIFDVYLLANIMYIICAE